MSPKGIAGNGSKQAGAWVAGAGRRTSRRKLAGPAPCIPIVDRDMRILGWTATPPEIDNGRLRHPRAERLLGGAIFCTQVALVSPEDISRAGGPPSWQGPWRCLALCLLDHARGFDLGRLATPYAATATSTRETTG